MSYFTYHSKQIYYEVLGEGEPLLFLHGNTASSKMFHPLLELYTTKYQVILIDFLGHGKSDRLDQFPLELWQDEAQQVIIFLEHLQKKSILLEPAVVLGLL